MIHRLNSTSSDFAAQLAQLLTINSSAGSDIQQRVAAIIAAISTQGDDALLHYTGILDNHTITAAATLSVSRHQCEQAFHRLDVTAQTALTEAAHHIRTFHRNELNNTVREWRYGVADGVTVGQRTLAADAVGIYVPGGTAAYPSSVLMTALAAHVAGVKRIVMVTPTPNGKRNDVVLAAAWLADVNEVYTIGGAQAIAALAYGTSTVPRVDMIVGPGNVYVAEAKRQLFGVVGIDMVAGPSEVVIVCDAGADPRWVAIDALSQAEHDGFAQAIIISDDASQLDKVSVALADECARLPRAAIAARSLQNRGALIVADSLSTACDVVNRIAPEHLHLAVRNADELLPQIRHAGAIFCGYHSCEALGDYCAGPNHVLPTNGTARFASPLGVHTFVRRSNIIRATAGAGTAQLARTAERLAILEGLDAHAHSAALRHDGWF